VAPLFGLMQEASLLISGFLRFADEYHPDREIVSRDHLGHEHRSTYAIAAARARRLAKALIRAGIVRHSAVVAARHPKWDERPILIVERQSGALVSKAELLEHLRSRVAKWWLPDDVVFIEAMPMTATGKIRKTELRERFSGHLLAIGRNLDQ
jgi:acyl-CoA synthetase (AMP-forming)/AMP-acid ligase II